MPIKNVKEAQQFNEERFSRTVLYQGEKSTAFVLNFLPGQSFPPHPHPNAHVYLHVIEGEGKCTINEEEYAVSEKDIIHCANEQKLGIENNSDQPLSIYVVLARE